MDCLVQMLKCPNMWIQPGPQAAVIGNTCHIFQLWLDYTPLFCQDLGKKQPLMKHRLRFGVDIWRMIFWSSENGTKPEMCQGREGQLMGVLVHLSMGTTYKPIYGSQQKEAWDEGWLPDVKIVLLAAIFSIYFFLLFLSVGLRGDLKSGLAEVSVHVSCLNDLRPRDLLYLYLGRLHRFTLN